MSLSFLSDENNTETFNRTQKSIIKWTVSTTIDNNNTPWSFIKSFINLEDLLILLAVVCVTCLLSIVCLILIVLYLMKKKRLYKNGLKSKAYRYPDNNYSSYQKKRSSSSIHMGLTSNHMSSHSNSDLMKKDSPSRVNTVEHRDKRACKESSITSSNTINPSATNDDVIETVNQVLSMEERNGKLYYKVNFVGHAADYTAWVCEDDLIPE